MKSSEEHEAQEIEIQRFAKLLVILFCIAVTALMLLLI